MVATWLWIGVFGMAIGSLGFLAYALTNGHRNNREELQGLLSFVVPLVAAIAYLAMALGQASFMLGDREVFWGRYADWSITTPLLLLHLVLLLQIRPMLTVGLLISDVIMIVTGFAGALADQDNGVNYLWWTVSTGAFVAILAILASQVATVSRKPGIDGRRVSVSRSLTGLLMVLWILYPILWLIGQTGTAASSPGTEVALFTILDLVAKVGFGIAVVVGVRSIPEPAESEDLFPNATQQPGGPMPAGVRAR